MPCPLPLPLPLSYGNIPSCLIAPAVHARRLQPIDQQGQRSGELALPGRWVILHKEFGLVAKGAQHYRKRAR